MATQLEDKFNKDAMTLTIDELQRLVKLLQTERDVMTENFKTTNSAYIKVDKELRELKEYRATLPPPPTINKSMV
jgi:flagellar biosynthesis chaperone FliJ